MGKCKPKRTVRHATPRTTKARAQRFQQPDQTSNWAEASGHHPDLCSVRRSCPRLMVAIESLTRGPAAPLTERLFPLVAPPSARQPYIIPGAFEEEQPTRKGSRSGQALCPSFKRASPMAAFLA